VDEKRTENTVELDASSELAVRREKLAALVAEGKNPYEKV